MDIAGLAVGILGLIVSLSGFIIAVWQIRRTRTAAEHAEEAAVKAREAIFHVTSVSDLSQASAQIEQIKELYRTHDWQRATDRYTQLRRVLTEVRSRLPDERRDILGDKLRRAIEQLIIIEIESNRAVARGNDIDIVRFQVILLRIQQDIDEARLEIERELTGTTDTIGSDEHDN